MGWMYAERCICDGDECNQFLEGSTYNPLQKTSVADDLLEAAEARGWMISREDNIAYCPMHTQLYISAWSRDQDV
jgi:hypothetical protein